MISLTLFPDMTIFRSDKDAIIEELYNLADNKLNINIATREDFQRIQYLNENEITAIINHIDNYGKILSLYELKNIPELDIDKIKLILPFLTTDIKEKFTLKNSLKYSNNQ